MEEKKKSKLPIVIAIFAVIFVVVIGGSYAYFSARATNSGTQITGQTLNIGGSTLTIAASRVTMNPTTTPVSDNLVPAVFGASPTEVTTTEVNRALTKQCSLGGYTGCHVWKITASTTQTVASANIRLNLNVANVTDKQEWSYVVYTGTDSSSTTILHKGLINSDFGDTTTTIDIHNGAALSANTPAIYYVMVYLNNTNSVQNDGVTVNTTNETGAYNGSVILEAMGGEVKVNFLPTAAEYITNLYTNAQKSTTTVNNITYNLAPSINLMNDRHASMSTDINGGDIRYYGANPNNYVWLGDTFTTDYTYTSNGESLTRTAGSKKLWRMIGVFDGRLKLIAADPILTQSLSWDTSADAAGENNGMGINQWGPSGSYEGADLMRLLNEGYTGTNGSLYWNKSTGTVYTGYNNATTADVSFVNTGLSASEKNLIDSVTWYLGAWDGVYNSGVLDYSDDLYTAERQNSTLGKICSSGNYCNDEVTRTSSWNGKVGLMYPSDYGYAVDLSLCTNGLYGYTTYPGDGTGYDNTNCKTNNWLYNSSYSQWTISPRADSSSAYYVFSVYSDGTLRYDSAYGGSRRVRPAIYLKPNVVINGGTGTEADPYVLAY